jgi:isopentenyl-diphosphate Delta-isomerase
VVAVEHVILLDESGTARGYQEKSTVHTGSTPLHLAFSGYLFNSSGQFLVTRRAAAKKTWPNIWTNSVCGHPQRAETVPDALRRRAAGELGLELDEVRLVLPEFRYRAELDGVVENEMCPVLYATVRGEPRPDPAEVGATRWMGWDEFLGLALAEDSGFSPWCRLQSRQLSALGADPRDWPAAEPARLPPAARL